MNLDLDQAHIWLLTLSDLKDDLSSLMDVLDESERERLGLIKAETHKKDFLNSHLFLRMVLAEYLEISPQAIKFHKNSYGKPELANESTNLFFSLTHTNNCAALVVSGTENIGLDAESLLRERTNVLALSERYFSASEYAAVEALEGGQQREMFFKIWTLKEAYLKARGIGISIPLDSFSFSFSPEEKIVSSEIEGEWGFHNFQYEDSVLALAGNRANTEVEFFKVASIKPLVYDKHELTLL